MTPDLALNFAISDAPRDLVRLVVPSTAGIRPLPRLLTDDVPAARLVKVLHGERRRLVDRRVHEDVAALVANRHGGVRRGQCDAATEDRLRLQRLAEGEREGRAAVDAGQGSLQDGPGDACRACFLVCGVLIEGQNRP